MPRPKKRNLKPNQAYLKNWDEYQKDRPGKTPILMPVAIDIDKGEIVRNRIKAGDIAALKPRLKRDLASYMFRKDVNPFHPEAIFDDYIKYFKDMDAAQGPVPTPLDIEISKPVWMLYYLPRKNWKFTKDRQYSTENDPDDITRNFEKIGTLNNRNYLLISNRCRSQPSNLKFNLHVTISQKMDGVKMETPIIIDPRSDHGGSWPN